MALAAIQALNGGTYEQIDSNFVAIATMEEKLAEATSAHNEVVTELNEKISEFEQKTGEQAEEITTLTTERDDALASVTSYENQVNSLQAELADYKNYKYEIEKQEKEAIIDSYAEQLNSEILDRYTENMDNYTAKELKKELAYELVEANPNFFSKNPTPQIVPKEVPLTGIEGILSKYSK